MLSTGTVEVHDTPTIRLATKKTVRLAYDLPVLVAALRHCRSLDLQAVLEMAIAMPGQSSTATLSQGYGIGIWEALLAAHEIPYTKIQPAIWKKAMLDGLPKDGGKGVAVLRAQQLFPSFQPTLVKHHNRADALLLAEWLRRQQTNGGNRGE